MRTFIVLFFLFKNVAIATGQQALDTIKSANPQQVTVRAYELNRKLADIPAAITYISRNDLSRFGNNSIVPAINATAGVRMEERSPGSYRINIRGSSLRSPFGVRNVKIYYNSIPFTDPGGNTYLNQLGYHNFQSIEIIKGPGSSVYGSGTGGVMLINNDASTRAEGVTAEYSVGSYQLRNVNANINFGSANARNVFNYQHQQSDGYRNHSKMRRDVFSWETSTTISPKDKLVGSFLYGDLFYETPGALTLAEFENNATAARPTIGNIPGSELADASIRQRTFLMGANYQHQFNDTWQSSTSAYAAFTKLDNPAIRNFARSFEPHVGGRTSWSYRKQYATIAVHWQTGVEIQQGFSTIRIYDNKRGHTDTLRSDEEISNLVYLIFSQVNFEYKRWKLTAGASYNRQSLTISHLTPLPVTESKVNFNNKLAPRLALLYKLSNELSMYASGAKGFSPPTTAELYPTGSIANPGLHAEEGWNYDLGIKGTIASNKLFADVNVFYFKLNNTIVQRRDAAGGDYFTNAGNTSQKGLEGQLWYQLFPAHTFFAPGKVWLNYMYYHFRYKTFKQLTADYSGNKIPGVAPQNVGAGADFNFKNGLYTNLTYQYLDAIPINDANTAYASSYHLLAVRLGYKKEFTKKLSVNVFAGVDNLFNERYSLGNDINGFGGRYYNAAPARNYFIGISIEMMRKPVK